MPEAGRASAAAPTPRHDLPQIDEAALLAARHADRLLAVAGEREAARWMRYLEPIPDALRDGTLAEIRQAAMRSRAAYGPKDSIRDALPEELTEPFLEAIDRLLKQLNRHDARG